MGKKLYYQALKQLPDHLVDDETYTTVLFDDTPVACNRKYIPMVFRDGAWQEIKFEMKAPDTEIKAVVFAWPDPT